MDWLMVTIMPIFIRALTTSTPLTAILCAKSATVMVSGTKTSCTTGSVGAWKACWFGSSLSFLPFFAAAYALVVTVACIVAVATAFAALAFGVAALVLFVTIAAVVFYCARCVRICLRRLRLWFSSAGLLRSPDLIWFLWQILLLARPVVSWLRGALDALVFLSTRASLMRTQGSGTARFFIALSLFSSLTTGCDTAGAAGLAAFFALCL